MAQKKSYSRYFIILQEDEKGYALASDKLPSGYAKLEMKNDKCKISYYVQNLKKESAPYYMILICNKKDVKKILRIGELNIDENGRADVSYEYGAENVANCGIGVDKIAGAAVVRFMNSNIIPVMSGFASTDIPDWRSFALIEEEQKRDEVKSEDKVQVKLEEKVEEKAEEKAEQRNVFDEYESKIESTKEVREVKEVSEAKEVSEVKVETKPAEAAQEPIRNKENEKNVEENKIEDLEIIGEDIRSNEDGKASEENKPEIVETAEKIELDSDENRHKKDKHKEDECKFEVEIEIKEEKEHHHKDDDHKEHCKDEKEHCKDEKDYCKEKKDYKHKDDYPKGNVGAFFNGLAEGFEELDGMCSEIKRCKWYKVPAYTHEDMNSCSDYNKHTVVYHPMISYYPYIKRYGHFILGYKCDKNNNMKYLVYGIPGTKSRYDQPYGGRSGFVTWIPQVEGEENENSFGYWLMFYDFRTSTIVVPVR